MNGSRMVRVLKRDGGVEDFDRWKLAAAIGRALAGTPGEFRDAVELSSAVDIYLRRRGCECVSSAALLEMVIKVLHRVGLPAAAEALEARHQWRAARRRAVHVQHHGGRVTGWDKSWLADFACRSWDLRRATGRIIAARVEEELLGEDPRPVSRDTLVERMNEWVVALGLADAVPVRQYALEG